MGSTDKLYVGICLKPHGEADSTDSTGHRTKREEKKKILVREGSFYLTYTIL